MKTIILVLAVLMSTNSFAAKTTKQVMNEVLKSFVGLSPFMSGLSKIDSKRKKEIVTSHLNTIDMTFKSAKHNTVLSMPGFAPSYGVIQEYIGETLDALNGGHTIFAQRRLQSLGSVCMSCHTQLKEVKGKSFSTSFDAIERINFNKEIEFAEYLFLTRRFSKAETSYAKAIRSSESSFEIKERALNRILAINLKIRYLPAKLEKKLSSFLLYVKKDKRMSSLINDRLKDLNYWKVRKSLKVRSSKDLRSFLDKHLGKIENFSEVEVSDISLLVASGMISKFIYRYPKNELVPEALYWLSVSDRKLNFNFFFSLSDLYLKNCIKSYPKSKMAPLCYKELEKQTQLGFTGSAGTDIPNEIKKELKKLKSLIL